MRVFLRPGEEIREEVSHHVLDHCLHQDLEAIRVEVHDGVVHLSGRISRPELIPVAVEMAASVEGVTHAVERLKPPADDA